MELIQARGLTKTFGGGRGRQRLAITAIDGVDLDVGTGEVVGFLGPNGAGKTTVMRVLATLLAPTSGSATVAGHDVMIAPRAVRNAIGYVAQSGSTNRFARVGDELVDHAQLYGMSRTAAEQSARELLGRLDLSGVWDRTVRTLSGGQRRRLDIAMGLVHSPRVVLMDEPTTGLDPQSRLHLWQLLGELRDGYGLTILLTTHYLDEADALSDRVIVFDHGKIVDSDSPEALKARVAGDLVEIVVASEHAAHVAGRILGGMTTHQPNVAGRLITGRVPQAGLVVPRLVNDLALAEIELTSLEVKRPTLDDVFLALTGRALRDIA